MNIDILFTQMSILAPALLAGVLVLSTHVPMGQEVLKRGIIFLDLAIAQMAALGLILASTLGFDAYDSHEHQHVPQGIAILAAVAGATLLYQFRRASAHIQEALIGTLFMLSATGSILLLAKDPHGGEKLKEILVGQILWVDFSDLIITATVYAVLLAAWFKWRTKMEHFLFYPMFAIAITLSTQLVGVYLVFASLIVPSLACMKHKRPLLSAYIVGFLGYFFGLLFSAIFDFPSGAMIAWCLSLMAALAYWINVLRVREIVTE